MHRLGVVSPGELGISDHAQSAAEQRQVFCRVGTAGTGSRPDVALEHIFYKWLRCQLVHEGALPVDIQFMADDDPQWMSLRAGGAPEYVLKIGLGWFHHVIGSVKQSPEYLSLNIPHGTA
jgi:hypothetical protein